MGIVLRVKIPSAESNRSLIKLGISKGKAKIEPPCMKPYAQLCERSGKLFNFPSYSIWITFDTVQYDKSTGFR